jgi:hypothetical protein
MPIWELTPVRPHDEHGMVATHKLWEAGQPDRILVRTDTEEHARRIAAEATYAATDDMPFAREWLDASTTQCMLAQESGYPEEGDDGVLVPPHYDKAWRHVREPVPAARSTRL